MDVIGHSYLLYRSRVLEYSYHIYTIVIIIINEVGLCCSALKFLACKYKHYLFKINIF